MIEHFKPRCKALLGTLIALALLIVVWWQVGLWYQGRLLADRRAQAAAESTPYGNALASAINRRFALLAGLRAFVQGHWPDLDAHLDPEFPALAASLYTGTEGIRNFSVAPAGVQRYVYPLAGNENVLGHDLLRDERPNVRADVQRAIQSHQIVVSGPYDLRQGGLGLVARQAIYRNDEFWGLVAMVLDVPPILDEAGLDPRTASLDLALRDGSGQVFYGSGAIFEAEPVIQRIELAEGAWELAGVPKEGWNASIQELLFLFQGAGLLIVASLVGVVYLVIIRQARLALAVQQRTQEIAQINEELCSELAERKQMEDRLRFQAQLLDSVRESVVATDLEGYIIYWGKGAETLYGYRSEEVMGELITFIVEPGEEEEEQERMRQVHENGSWRGQYRQKRKDGASFWADTAISLVRDERGQPLWLIGIDRDITGRKQADEERRRLSAAIEQAAESVIITDTAGTILYVNPAFERVSGYTRTEAIGQNPRFLKSGKQNKAFYREMWAVLTAGQVWQGRFINQKKDGAFFTVDTTITPVRDESGTTVNYVGIQRDVTHELQLEEQYRQAQKMEAVGQLAAGIAHDFNNLLVVINGFAALLQAELSPDDSHWEPVGKILNAGQRAAELVRQLLAFSRKQIIEPRVLDLNVLVSELDKMLRRTLGEHIELSTTLAPDLWPVEVDPAQLEHVVVNLAINARDAMPDGGRLTIETANVVLDDDYATGHVGTLPGEHVLLAVSDTGHGMSQKVQSHLFEPFFTTKEVGKGTGLGLATVYGAVKQNGGHIWVYSEEGIGTTFKIYLPRAVGAAQAQAQSEDGAAMPSGSETVLLVEDHGGVRDLARRVLQGQGYTLLEATDGREALRLAARHSGPIHLLLTDVVMPGINGEALSEQLVKTCPGLKVLFMSGYPDSAIAQHGVLDPEVAFLQKPFHPTILANKVRAVLDS